jgi:hypothetical protein
MGTLLPNPNPDLTGDEEYFEILAGALRIRLLKMHQKGWVFIKILQNTLGPQARV